MKRLPDEGSRMTTFVFDAKTLNSFKNLATKEGKSMRDLLQDYMADYIKIHGDGNPSFTLEQFLDPNFKAVPAVFRDAKTWQEYLASRNKTELKEFESQMNVLINAYNQASKKVF